MKLQSRIWDKSRQEYHNNLCIDTKGLVTSNNPQDYEIDYITGLTCYNTKDELEDLYNNDLISIDDEVYIISWSDTLAGFIATDIEGSWCSLDVIEDGQYKIVKIGDIHNNPELFK